MMSGLLARAVRPCGFVGRFTCGGLKTSVNHIVTAEKAAFRLCCKAIHNGNAKHQVELCGLRPSIHAVCRPVTMCNNLPCRLYVSRADGPSPGQRPDGPNLGQGGRSPPSDNKTVLIYITATGVFMLGLAYAGVPLYRMFCQATGQGGQAVQGHDTSKVETMAPIKDRVIKISFNADTASSMQWNFKPQQKEVKLVPGETALAFYRAKNPTDKPIIGISTYNVIPFEAGLYFNKIQCFCFEEQRLNPHEEVDMPVFFFIDPEFAEDPRMMDVDTITLSYTFFEAKEGFTLPQPAFMMQQSQ